MNKESTKLYGECAYLLDKIFDKCETMNGGWDLLIDYLASIDDNQFQSEEEFYHYYYKFIRNVYWRIHRWGEAQDFNKVRKKEVDKRVEGNKTKKADGFVIWNYDYKMFLWALRKNHTWGLNTSMIEVAIEDLTESELKRLEKMSEQEQMRDLEIRVIFLEQCVAKIMKVLFDADYEQICNNARKRMEDESKNV